MNPATTNSALRLRPLGDAAVLIELGDEVGADAHRAVTAASDALRAGAAAFDLQVVPAYTSVAVHYEPRELAGGEASPYTQVCDRIRELLSAATTSDVRDARLIEVPVRYGGAEGPDLQDVAHHAGLDPDEVVRLHAAAEYTVHMIGFAPGFPYLAGLPRRLATPRRESPRARVPAGSVGIAGAQTGIYPRATPGGWRLIGRTDVRLFDAAADPPALLCVGDRVRFVRVT